MAEDNAKLVEQIETLRKEMDELLRQQRDAGPLVEMEERLSAVEDSRQDAFGWDSATPDMIRSGDLMDVRKMPTSLEDKFEILPFDIEHCVMKADASGTAATVVVRPTDEEGTEYSPAADVEIFVANDRSPQLLEDRGWKRKSTATVDGQAAFGGPESTITLSAGTFELSMVGQWVKYDTSGNTYEIITYTDSTHVDVTGDASSETNNDGITISGDILSFIRFAPTVSGAGGVLVGEGRKSDLFVARLDNEDSGGGGEYDEWAEVEADTETGALKTKVGGRTHTTTSESLWESNGVEGMPTGTYVLVHIEGGDNILYIFEVPAGIESTSGPLTLNKWFDITGNQGYTDIDTRDYSRRNIEIACYWYGVVDQPTPANLVIWYEEGVQLWSPEQSAWNLANDLVHLDRVFRFQTNVTGAAQDIMKIIQGGNTSMEIRMEATTGKLQLQVTAYDNRTQLWLSIRTGARMLPENVVAVP